ncbi:sensor histidine kinase [Actinoplanes sp. M2I2]|uniref:sensor histidine kinase n=1 Tax=Actinoplanes sp. M2I2 TaxID=1734444 RepID=UPI0020223E03|nr:ATP-binding protein [Actinoplanes sp. M2I2]
MSIEAELRAEFDSWERKETVALRVLPYVLLTVCAVVALLLPLWPDRARGRARTAGRARVPEAIGEVTRRWSEVYGIEAALTVTGDPRPMHSDVGVTLLRAAQEALADVAKHARAGRVGLTLSYMANLVTLDVRDDGVGFDPTRRAGRSANGGFGLAGLRQRVQRLAGRLDIESEPGGGTAISASVPAIPAGGGQ